MGEKKKSNANTTALIGAAFLMATSAIGPGFLTQTATFTGQYGSIFALAIICTILLDVTTQLNICLAGDLLDTVQHHRRCIIIVICHNNVVASVQQFDAGVAADITGAAGNQNCHSLVPLSLIYITVDAGIPRPCLKNTAFMAQNQGMRLLFR